MICPTLKQVKLDAIRSLLNMIFVDMKALNIALSITDEISPNTADTLLMTAQGIADNICLCSVSLNEDVKAFAKMFEEDKSSVPSISVIA